MEIKIKIPPYFAIKVLDAFGYVTENVTLYYNEYDSDDIVNLKPIVKSVAYPGWHERPKSLDKEFPLLEDVKGLLFDNVVEELFNSWIMETLSAHPRPIKH